MYKKWIKDDAYAMFLLTSAMDFSQITLIENCETSKEILDKLDAVYEQKSETSKMLAHERFSQYKMEPNDSIAQHIAKVENLARQLKEAGEEVSDIAIITKILGSLPQKFRSFRQAWLSMDETKQTIKNLASRLIDEDTSLTKADDSDKAFATSSRTDKVDNKWDQKQKVKFRERRVILPVNAKERKYIEIRNSKFHNKEIILHSMYMKMIIHCQISTMKSGFLTVVPRRIWHIDANSLLIFRN